MRKTKFVRFAHAGVSQGRPASGQVGLWSQTHVHSERRRKKKRRPPSRSPAKCCGHTIRQNATRSRAGSLDDPVAR